jgi:hypothetical protein
MESCQDGFQNQDETDVDCGGTICGTCAENLMCMVNEDCMSNQCVDGLCFGGCLDDEACNDLDDVCYAGVCNMGVCEQVPTDGAACDTGDLCLPNGMCNAGACEGQPVDCSGLDDFCGMGTCNPDDGQCIVEPINEGVACNDNDKCSVGEACTAGACGGGMGGTLFYEEFANNMAGWTLDMEWQIGPAVAACGDPATDHTPNDNNGVAGVVIGGCAGVAIHAYYCLTSPIIDTAGEPAVWMTYYRDLWSDYTPYMKNKLEVYNGNSWIILFETFGAPEWNDPGWTYASYDVSAHANANMQFRWCHNINSGGAFNRGSWSVDDVTVAKNQCNVSDP